MSYLLIMENNELYEFKSMYNKTLLSCLKNFENDDEAIITCTVIKKSEKGDKNEN